MDMLDTLLEFLSNKVIEKHYFMVNDIPTELLGKYEKNSKELAETANDIYNFNHSI